ncbi:MAG TPA: hypothetical protein VD931_17155 [Baekduia sp.]|nr:hypothetical protein [Baekduia sp.]
MAAPFAVAADPLLADLVAAAVLAPSSHNTQPWRFRVTGERLELWADRRRRLPVNDPDDRELTISCGAALLNARVAARHAGRELAVTLLPDAGEPDLLARATLGREIAAGVEPLRAAIADRRTHRARFLDEPVDAGIVRRLEDAAATEGAWLEVLDEDRRGRLAELVAAGDQHQFADARWRRELASWMHPRRAGDGLVFPGAVVPVTRFVIRHLDVGSGTAGRDAKLAAGSPVLALLATHRDDPRSWLRAGQALQRLLLTAAASGLQASFLNQPVQVADLRPQACALLDTQGVAHLVLRLGRPAKRLAPAPRRPVHDVLQED